MATTKQDGTRRRPPRHATAKTRARSHKPARKTSGRRFPFTLAAFSASALALLAGGAAAVLLRRRNTGGEHAAPDLALEAPKPGTDRAPEAFRPDATAAVPESERESLRPAMGRAPTLAADRGEMRMQTASGNA